MLDVTKLFAQSRRLLTPKEKGSMVKNLGQPLYWSAMQHCAAVVGNLSSGTIEAPAFNVPTVNIGNRQAGRLRATSIIDCTAERSEIIAALKSARPQVFDTIRSSVLRREHIIYDRQNPSKLDPPDRHDKTLYDLVSKSLIK